MQTTINRELLRHHVGHVMFCPTCKTCLDVSSSVSFDIGYKEVPKLSQVICTPCFDEHVVPCMTRLQHDGFTVTVLDGRVLFPRKRRARKS